MIIISEQIINNYIQILKDNLSDQINSFVLNIFTLFLSINNNNNNNKILKISELLKILDFHHIISYYNIESSYYRHILLLFYNQSLLSNNYNNIPLTFWKNNNNNYIDNIIYILMNIDEIDKVIINIVSFTDTIIFMKTFIIIYGKEGLQYLFSTDHSRINIYYQMLLLMEKLLIEIMNNNSEDNNNYNNILEYFKECFVFMNVISIIVSLENHLKEFGSYNLAVVVVGKFIRIIQSNKEYDKIKYNAQNLLEVLNSKS